MARHGESRSFVQRCVLLTFLVVVAGREICDKTKCPGPLKFYEGLGCTPTYKNPGDCCAEGYDCSHLKKLSKDKCYANGHEYNVGEALRDEDANACDKACICQSYNNEPASFICAALDCGIIAPRANCFNRHTHDQCCPGPYVCLEEGEKRATCEVDGKTYQDGDYFQPKSDPDLDCYCMPGYKGENVEPFCKKPNRPYCSPLFRNAGTVHDNCAPVFYSGQSPQKDCSYAFRCQNANDTVIHNHDHTKSVSEEEDKICRFGDMVMHLGDELEKGTSYESKCEKCVCEVPPFPTCQRITDKECGIVYDFGPNDPVDSSAP
ncbi:kielin/chordin-like protein [Xylocopa sonorina]|uniref:kielin/chordin-like protein n=1 Tax=Xylocopa sonorina TaxID=1818115 RepID=UPI00403B03D6